MMFTTPLPPEPQGWVTWSCNMDHRDAAGNPAACPDMTQRTENRGYPRVLDGPDIWERIGPALVVGMVAILSFVAGTLFGVQL